MKKFLLILLLLVLLVAGGLVFIVYRALDEDSYKQQILDSTQQLLGRQMQINGRMSITLFPSPVIKLSDVVILNPPGFEHKHVAVVESVEAHVELASLLSNPLVVQNIVLKKPQFFLEKNEKSVVNWNFNFLKTSAMLYSSSLSGMNAGGLPPQFQNTQIEDGSLIYTNKPLKTTLSIEKINGKLQAGAINGPFDFKGQISIAKLPLDTLLHIDTIGSNIESKFNFTLSALNNKVSLSVSDGKINKFSEPAQQISGSFSSSISDLSMLVKQTTGNKDLPPELNKPVKLAGQFDLSAQNVTLDNLALVYGDVNSDIALSGKLVFVYPLTTTDKMKTDAVLNFSQLNLDLLKPYTKGYTSFADFVEKTKQVLPSSIDFLLTSTHVTLWKQQISDLSVKGRFYDGILDVFEINANLPEKTRLTGSGNIVTDEQKQFASLFFDIKSDDLQPTLAWVNDGMPFLQNAPSLKNMQLSAKLNWTPQVFSIKRLNMQIEQGKITGDISVPLSGDTASVQLQLDSLNLDHFSVAKGYAQEQSFKQALSDFQNYVATSVLFTKNPVRLNVTANNITFKTLPVQKVVFVGNTSVDTIDIENLDVTQVATSNMRYVGKISKDSNNRLTFDNVNATLDVPKAKLLFDRLKVQSPIPSSIGNINTDMVLNGTLDDLSLSAQSSIAQGRIKIEGQIKNLLSDATTYDLQTKINFPSLVQFMRLFHPTYKGNPNLTGSFAFDGIISVTHDAIKFKNSDLTVGPQKVILDLTLSQPDGIVQASGKITSPQLYLDKFVTSSSKKQTMFDKDLLDFSSLDDLRLDVILSATRASWENFDMENFETHVLLNEKILQVQDTKAQIEKGKVTVNATLNFSAATPYLKGRLVLNALPVQPDVLKLGTFYLKNGDLSMLADFDTKGNSIDDMVRALSTKGNFSVANGTISGLNLKAFERRSQAMIIRTDIAENTSLILNRELTTGETAFVTFGGTYAVTKGILRTTDTVLKTQTANALVQLEWNIPAWTISSSVAISFKNLSGYPPVSIYLKGTAQNPQTQVDLSSFVKYINDTASDVRNTKIREQREQEEKQRQAEQKDRLKQIAQLTLQAQTQIENTEKTLKLAPSEAAQMQLIRAKDSFVLLQELSKKTDPSEADLAKASTQATQIQSRTQSALSVVNNEAGNAVREQISKDSESAQSYMQSIQRVYQRLGNAQVVAQVYQQAKERQDKIEQLKVLAVNANDMGQLQQVLMQSNQALEEIKSLYESIQKYDVDATAPYSGQTTRTMQGSIRRN